MSAQPRILVLWANLTSYLLASVQELQSQHGDLCEIVVVSGRPTSGYPSLFDEYKVKGVKFLYYDNFNYKEFRNYDLVLVSSWNFLKYHKWIQLNRNTCVVMAMDNQYLGTWKQKLFLGSGVGPRYIRNLVHFVYVAGSRQAEYATKIGFKESQIRLGTYAYDSNHFQDLLLERKKQFVFIGRKVQEKGLDVLLRAYEIYRVKCQEEELLPWGLVVAGPGKLERNVQGCTEIDYISPKIAAELLSQSYCLILPSKKEPFGVVAVEAAASGCLVIATDAVGAGDGIINQGVNGFVVPAQSPRKMAEAMLATTRLTPHEFEIAQKESVDRSDFYKPSNWTKRLVEMLNDHANQSPSNCA